ncbi:MAG: hypothetical protein U9P14_01395 [Gemmatimonadota bacterium]|nr:hypothetical protein [Gemmatimonadota bacterium]
MVEPYKTRNKRLFKILLLLFAASYLMSNGPGVLLVNKPVLVAGIPILYLWALVWGIVQIGLILYAYFKLWRHEIEPGHAGSESSAGTASAKEAGP